MGHEGPDGQYRYNCTLSLTSALEGVSGQRNTPAVLPPGKGSGTYCIGGWGGPGVGPGPRYCGKMYLHNKIWRKFACRRDNEEEFT